ncbi:UNVERIFIED_ORG: hypothetical protein QE446_004958 [Rhizobium sp. SORGH_AS260]|nr:hypothetical protein [Rhizobium sp. SORGH_AS_0285]MDP9757034.1 hypothetical protein [Rhizobium sp. SORGH_AS_0260]MDR6083717.1 hypothetical protein [Agrobacterium sp. SORGH_AS_0440]
MKILIVEDEALLAMELESEVEEALAPNVGVDQRVERRDCRISNWPNCRITKWALENLTEVHHACF